MHTLILAVALMLAGGQDRPAYALTEFVKNFSKGLPCAQKL